MDSSDEIMEAFHDELEQSLGQGYYPPDPPDFVPPIIEEIAEIADEVADFDRGYAIRSRRSNKVNSLFNGQIKNLLVTIFTIADNVIDNNIVNNVIERITSSQKIDIHNFFGYNGVYTSFPEQIRAEIKTVLTANRDCVLELTNVMNDNGMKLENLIDDNLKYYLVQWSYLSDYLSPRSKVLILYYIYDYALEYARFDDKNYFLDMIGTNILRLIKKTSGTFNFGTNGQQYPYPSAPMFPSAAQAPPVFPQVQSGFLPVTPVFSQTQSGFLPAPSVLRQAQSGSQVIEMADDSTQQSQQFHGSFQHSALDLDSSEAQYFLKQFDVINISFSDICREKFAQGLSDSSRNSEAKKNLDSFLQIALKYSAIHDFIDMVHDTTKCYDFLLAIFEAFDPPKEVIFYGRTFVLTQETITSIIHELNTIMGRLCSSAGNIIIVQSHVLQEEYAMEFIVEIQKMGINIPALSDDVPVSNIDLETYVAQCFSKNGDQKLNVTRESGRELNKNFTSGAEMVNNVKNNNVGAIDGCKGQCDLTPVPITWTHNIAGCCEIHITSTGTGSTIRSIITVSLFGNDLKKMIFEVIGEITLDAVLALMGFNSIRGSARDNIEIISPIPPDSSGLTDEEQKVMIMSLKTLCDQRLLQLMQTTHNGSTQQLWCVTTVDSYVAIVNLIKFIILVGLYAINTQPNNITADFPKIFLTAADNSFRMRSYSLNPDTTYFEEMIKLLLNEHKVLDHLNKATVFIEESASFRDQSDITFFPNKVLAFFENSLLDTYKGIWEKKKDAWLIVYNKALKDFEALKSEVQGTPTLTQILLTLSRPPDINGLVTAIEEAIYSVDDVCDSLFGDDVVDWSGDFEIVGDFIIIEDPVIINNLITNKHISRDLDDIFETGTDGKEFLKIPITIELLLKLSFKIKQLQKLAAKATGKRDRSQTSIISNDEEIDELLANKLQMLYYGKVDVTRTTMKTAIVRVLKNQKDNFAPDLANITLVPASSLSLTAAAANSAAASQKKKHRKSSSSKPPPSKKSRKSSSPEKNRPKKPKSSSSKNQNIRNLKIPKQHPSVRPGSGARGSSNSRQSKPKNRGGARRTYKKQKIFLNY